MKACVDCFQPAVASSKHKARCARCERERKRAYSDPAHLALPRFGRCGACGQVGRVEIDHIVPLWDGGTSHPSNLQQLCPPCHRLKGRADGAARRSKES